MPATCLRVAVIHIGAVACVIFVAGKRFLSSGRVLFGKVFWVEKSVACHLPNPQIGRVPKSQNDTKFKDAFKITAHSYPFAHKGVYITFLLNSVQNIMTFGRLQRNRVIYVHLFAGHWQMFQIETLKRTLCARFYISIKLL